LQLYKENDREPYSGWVRFVGSLLVISATQLLPSIFVIRLIWKKEEKHQNAQFINFTKRCHAAWDDLFYLFFDVQPSKNEYRYTYYH